MFQIAIRQTDGPLRNLHQQLMRGRWEDCDWASFRPEAYGAEARATMVEAWRARLVDEYRSATVFSQFQTLLMLACAPLDVVGCCTRVVQDEVRHVQLCTDVIRALGGEPHVGAPPEAFRLVLDPEGHTLVQALDLTVYLFCLGETASVHAIEATRDATGDPVIREVLRRFASDERLHTEFGWQLAEVLLAETGQVGHAVVAQQLPPYLAILEDAFASYGEAPEVPTTAELAHLGTLDRAAHRQAFYAGLEADVLPRLRKLGFDADAAWAARRQSA